MFWTGIFVQSCGHPSLTGLIPLCTEIYVQSCGHSSLTGDIKQRQAARTHNVVFMVALHYQSLQIIVLLLQPCLLGSEALSRTLQQLHRLQQDRRFRLSASLSVQLLFEDSLFSLQCWWLWETTNRLKSINVLCILHITVNLPGGIFNKRTKGNSVLSYMQREIIYQCTRTSQYVWSKCDYQRLWAWCQLCYISQELILFIYIVVIKKGKLQHAAVCDVKFRME